MREKKAEKARLPLLVLKRQPNGAFRLTTRERGSTATSNSEVVKKNEKVAIEAPVLLSCSTPAKVEDQVGGLLEKQAKRKRTMVDYRIDGGGRRRRQWPRTEKKAEAKEDQSGEIRVWGTSFEMVDRMGGSHSSKTGATAARAPLKKRLVLGAPSSTVVVWGVAQLRAVSTSISTRLQKWRLDYYV